MLKDQKDLLRALNAHGVRYLVIGGHAVGFHAEPRGTKDLDVWIESSESNSRAVFEALAEFGAPLSGLSPADFRDTPETMFQVGLPPSRVDILQSAAGVDWDQAWRNRVERFIDPAVPVHVISSDDLIANKLSFGRDVDLVDVRKIREARSAGLPEMQHLTILLLSGWKTGFNKIACTKAVRAVTGLNLTEGKAVTDAVLRGESIAIKVNSKQVDHAIRSLLQTGLLEVRRSPNAEV